MKEQSKTPAPSKKIPTVEVFYDARDGSYWYRVNGRYLKLSSRDLKMHLKADHGLSDNEWVQTGGGGMLRQTEVPLFHAQKSALVDYAGPLAGHRTGIFVMGNEKFLVTDEPATLWDDLPKKYKKPELFISFIQELLDGDQWQFFAHWLAFALASLRNGDFSPGQCVVLAGESGCGKSFLQLLITKILGGRHASPFRYMMEQTQFNSDLARGEHWQIEDPASTTDIKTRRLFGAKLKEALVNLYLSIQQKGKDALPLPVFRRVTISVNKEPENLSVIPPLDDSITDKIFLFLCQKVVKTFEPFITPGTTQADRKKVMAAFESEIPAIRSWLLYGQPKIQKAFQDSRMSIRSFQHPELLSELEGLSPESRMLALMDETLWTDWKPEDLSYVEAKSIEIERKLRESEMRFEAEKILKYPGACGTYLGRLAKSHPERVSKRMLHGYIVWQIKKPVENDDKNQLKLGVTDFAVKAGNA